MSKTQNFADEAMATLIDIMKSGHIDPLIRIRAADVILQQSVKKHGCKKAASKNWRPKPSKYPKVYGKPTSIKDAVRAERRITRRVGKKK